jgi:hypothetical protein
MKHTTTVLFLLAALSAHAQLENKGWWTRDLITYRSDYNKNPDLPNSSVTNGRFLTQPEIGYALNERWLVGIIGQYSHTFSRINNNQARSTVDDRFWGAGPLVRYYVPLGKRVALMPEVFFTYYFGEKREYVRIFNAESEIITKYNSVGAGAFPSLVCFLTRDLALSLTVASFQYYGNKNGHSLIFEVNPQQWLLGVEYYFERKGKKDGG